MGKINVLTAKMYQSGPGKVYKQKFPELICIFIKHFKAVIHIEYITAIAISIGRTKEWLDVSGNPEKPCQQRMYESLW